MFQFLPLFWSSISLHDIDSREVLKQKSEWREKSFLGNRLEFAEAHNVLDRYALESYTSRSESFVFFLQPLSSANSWIEWIGPPTPIYVHNNWFGWAAGKFQRMCVTKREFAMMKGYTWKEYVLQKKKKKYRSPMNNLPYNTRVRRSFIFFNLLRKWGSSRTPLNAAESFSDFELLSNFSGTIWN